MKVSKQLIVSISSCFRHLAHCAGGFSVSRNSELWCTAFNRCLLIIWSPFCGMTVSVHFRFSFLEIVCFCDTVSGPNLCSLFWSIKVWYIPYFLVAQFNRLPNVRTFFCSYFYKVRHRTHYVMDGSVDTELPILFLRNINIAHFLRPFLDPKYTAIIIFYFCSLSLNHMTNPSHIYRVSHAKLTSTKKLTATSVSIRCKTHENLKVGGVKPRTAMGMGLSPSITVHWEQ